MAEEDDPPGQTAEKAADSVHVETPQLLGDEAPLLVGWGKFEGPAEKLYGALYFEIDRKIEHFKAFNLAVSNEPEKFENFNPQDQPLLFQQNFDQVPEFSGELKQADYTQAAESIKKFAWDTDKQQMLWEAVESFDKETVYDWWYRLLSSVVMKGKLDFEAGCQLITQKALSRSMGGALEENRKDDSEREGEEGEGDEEDLHFISLVTAPFKGIAPEEVEPGDEIYVRATGSVAKQFPEEMQSDRYDFATVPIEAQVVGVGETTELPPSYEGKPENYFKIKANFGGAENGQAEVGEGYIYKDEKVKPAFEIEEEGGVKINYKLVAFFIGLGIICITLSVAAYWIFG